MTKFPLPILFPVAMDKKADPSFDYSAAARKLCKINPYFSILSEVEKESTVHSALKYLKGLDSISLTFTMNQLRGTPTFLLISDNFEILYHTFGYTDHPVLKNRLQHFIDKFTKDH